MVREVEGLSRLLRDSSYSAVVLRDGVARSTGRQCLEALELLASTSGFERLKLPVNGLLDAWHDGSATVEVIDLRLDDVEIAARDERLST
ncbi:MAG: hypothetical protein GY925_16510 [Actinomycetia bacterium]|nr:hypothetical protein [Actinomycetes bacterium]